jgi:TolB-like protein
MFVRLLDNLRRRGVITVMAPYTVGAWVLMQVIAVLQPALALPAWVMSLVTVILIVGFPVAFYIAWFFELTDDGLKRTTLEDEASLVKLSVFHWAGLGVASIAALGVGFFIFQEVSDNLAKDAEGIKELALEQSIAVLPFKDQSADQDQKYIAEGIADELTNILGGMRGLKVAAASSTFRLTEQDFDPIAIGRRLDVATLLGGSIRSQGDQLKVRVELINVGDGKVLWTQSFSRKLADIFAVEEEISRSIVNLLQDRYLEKGEVTVQSRTANTDAYLLHLRGEEEFRKRTPVSVKAARKFFEEAIGLDPEYAPARVGLAKTVLLLAKGTENVGKLDRKVAATLAEQSLNKALVRAPRNAEAFATLGRMHVLRGDHEAALSAYEKAIQLNPNLAAAYLWKFLSLRAERRYSDAHDAIEEALRLDPASLPVLHNMALEHNRLYQLDEAYAISIDLIELYPQSPMGHRVQAGISWQRGDLADSVRSWKRVFELAPDHFESKFDYIGLLMMLGLIEEAKPLATDPFWEANILLMEGKYQELHEKMAFDVAAHPDDPWVTFEAGWYHYLVGDLMQGVQLMARVGEMLGASDLYGMPMCSPAIEIAFAYKKIDRNDEAEDLIDQCRARVVTEREGEYYDSDYDFLAARMAAMAGDGDLAAKELQKAYDKGWRDWWVGQDPLLSSLDEHPGAQKTIGLVLSAIQLERRKLEAEGS